MRLAASVGWGEAVGGGGAHLLILAFARLLLLLLLHLLGSLLRLLLDLIFLNIVVVRIRVEAHAVLILPHECVVLRVAVLRGRFTGAHGDSGPTPTSK